MQNITKEEITGALKGSLTIDNRLLTSSGREGIVSDFSNLGTNLATGMTGFIGNISSLGKTTYDVITKKEITLSDVVSEWKSNQEVFVNQNNYDRGIINNLSEGKSVEEIEYGSANTAKIYYDESDIDMGFRVKGDKEEGNNFLNAAQGTATDTRVFVETHAHENAHRHTSNEAVAESAGSFAKFMWSVGNALNFTGTNTSGNASASSWYTSNQGSSLLQYNTNWANSISSGERYNSTLAYRGTKSILNALGIETSNGERFEDNIASSVFGLTIGTTEEAIERQDNMLYGLQNAGKEYAEIPEDLIEVGKDVAGIPGKVIEEVKATYAAKEEIIQTATDTGIGGYYFDGLVYASVNPQETASKLGNAIDAVLFGTIRSGFENDNLIYGIGEVFTGTLSDIGLLYGGANLLRSGKTIVTGSKIWDYSKQFKTEVIYNFNNDYIIKNIVGKDLYLVQLHSDASLGAGRSLKYWTTFEEMNKISTIDEYMDKMSLLSEWGIRNNVSIAKVPQGAKVKYAVGFAKKKIV